MIQHAETRRNLHTHTHTHTHGCLCKIIISIFAILAITNPSYSTTISGTGTECNENTLNTDTGPATLQAQWNANTINLNWYSDDIQITVPTASNTCTYDGGITLPTTNPTKEGYTFGGWRVRQSTGAMSVLLSEQNMTLDANMDNGYYAWKPLNGNSGYTVAQALQEEQMAGTDHSADLNNGEWALTFNYGTVKGISSCNTTLPSNYDAVVSSIRNAESFENAWAAREQAMTILWGQNGSGIKASNSFSQSATGQNCWCQAKWYDADKDGTYTTIADSSWVFLNNYNDESLANADVDCESRCAYSCVIGVSEMQEIRSAVFGAVQ